MEYRDELLTIAEIAISIAGFSGVVAAFLQPGGLHRVDRVRFVTLFTTAFSTLALTFVPLVLGVAGLTGEALWTGSSVVMIIAWLLNSIVAARILPVMKDMGKEHRPSAAIVYPSLLNLLVQMLNAAGTLLPGLPLRSLRLPLHCGRHVRDGDPLPTPT